MSLTHSGAPGDSPGPRCALVPLVRRSSRPRSQAERGRSSGRAPGCRLGTGFSTGHRFFGWIPVSPLDAGVGAIHWPERRRPPRLDARAVATDSPQGRRFPGWTPAPLPPIPPNGAGSPAGRLRRCYGFTAMAPVPRPDACAVATDSPQGRRFPGWTPAPLPRIHRKGAGSPAGRLRRCHRFPRTAPVPLATNSTAPGA